MSGGDNYVLVFSVGRVFYGKGQLTTCNLISDLPILGSLQDEILRISNAKQAEFLFFASLLWTIRWYQEPGQVIVRNRLNQKSISQ